MKDINNWVDQKTDHMIPGILNEIPENTLMYLINAVTFNAKWQNTYADDDIFHLYFTAWDGTEQNVNMMYSEESYYLKDEQATGFYKYYEGGRYAFGALLPDENISVMDYVQNLTPEHLYQILANPERMEVHVRIPEFSYDYGIQLSDPLIAMGMSLAFSDHADFSDMMNISSKISQVTHKTFIDVSPKGTKAAAATLIETMPTEAYYEYIALDRPFIYFIVDTETSLPIFMGILNQIS